MGSPRASALLELHRGSSIIRGWRFHLHMISMKHSYARYVYAWTSFNVTPWRVSTYHDSEEKTAVSRHTRGSPEADTLCIPCHLHMCAENSFYRAATSSLNRANDVMMFEGGRARKPCIARS